MDNDKILSGIFMDDYMPDYTKSKDENDRIFREKYKEAYGEYPEYSPDPV